MTWTEHKSIHETCPNRLRKCEYYWPYQNKGVQIITDVFHFDLNLQVGPLLKSKIVTLQKPYICIYWYVHYKVQKCDNSINQTIAEAHYWPDGLLEVNEHGALIFDL